MCLLKGARRTSHNILGKVTCFGLRIQENRLGLEPFEPRCPITMWALESGRLG